MSIKQVQLTVILLTLAGVAAIAGIIIFILSPTMRDIRQLSTDIIAAQVELEAQYTNRKNLTESIAQVNQIRQTSHKLASQFIQPGEELTFITRVEDIATENGLESSIRMSAASQKGGSGLNEIFEVVFNGPFANVQQALVEFERLANLTIIDAVIVRAGEISAEAPTVISMTLRGKIAFMPKEL